MPAPGSGPIVVVGGGASTAFLLHHLAADSALDRPVVVIEPAPRIGPGVAYRTPDPVHLMNVCRIRLSVDGDNGADLVGWLGDRGIQADADTYLQRSMYGEYLADVSGRCATAVGVDHRRSRVSSLRRIDRSEGAGWLVELDDGSVVVAGDVVLATGFPARPVPPCAVPEGDPRVVSDPWQAGVYDRAGLDRVAIVGTGLTMVDVALSLVERHPDVEIVAASRRGLLPRTSRPGLPAQIDAGLLPEPGIAGRALVHHLIRLGRSHDDWQAVVDNVRPRANELWRGLTYGEQAHILRRWFPWWNVHRHRTAPAVGARLAQLLESGQLRIVRSRVVEATAGGGGRLTVRYSSPRVSDQDADLLVNAAGPSDDLSVSGDAIVRELLAAGEVVIGPHRLGLGVDRAGRAVGRDGPTPGLWLIGALRRGTEWETTAVPELRIQAGTIGARLVRGDAGRELGAVEVGRC
jgi:uncharacterized NAD(P)/FAD-binding protein YdhS